MRIAISLTLLLFSTATLAHPGHLSDSDLLSGLLHPLLHWEAWLVVLALVLARWVSTR